MCFCVVVVFMSTSCDWASGGAGGAEGRGREIDCRSVRRVRHVGALVNGPRGIRRKHNSNLSTIESNQRTKI